MSDLTFFSHMSTGLGAAATDLPVDDQLQVGVSLNLVARPSGTAHTIHQTVGLYRPCDVVGLDPGAVLRTDPEHRIPVAEFEPNYLPVVEFASPDLPWRFTSEQPTDGRRAPWLALVVLAEDEFDDSAPRAGSEAAVPQPPAIRIHQPAAVLPPADQMGAWAHVQGAGALEATSQAELEALTKTSLTAFRSRLIAARRLRPHARYRACLIPTFECGRLRGLNPQAAHEHVPGFAWSPSAPTDLDFPVYFSWDFATSAYGDIEALAERIEPRSLDPSTGTRPLRVPAQEYQIPASPMPMRYEGAVVSTELEPAPDQPDDTTTRLVEVLNAPRQLAEDTDTADIVGAPAVAPPIYGQWHAQRHRVEAPAPEGETKPWVSELNAYLAYRAAAGLGAEVIRRDQEELVAEAWRQVGDVLRANERICAAQLGFLVSTRLFERSMKKLSQDALVLASRPLHAKLREPGEKTLLSDLDATNMRGLAQSAKMRSALAPRGATRRLFASRATAFNAATAISTIAHSSRVKSMFEPGIVDPSLQSFVAKTSAAADADGGDSGSPIDPATNERVTEADPAGAKASPESVGPKLGPVDLGSVAGEILERSHPAHTIPARINALVDGIQIASPNALCSAVMPAPEFDIPVYAPLRDLAVSHIFPGVGDIPANTAALLSSNQKFIESFMAGANHEMAAELLWRGYPTDLRGTYFHYFWDSGGDFADVDRLHAWSGRLGSNRARGAAEPLVLLLRADVIQRYPGLMMYAQKATIDAAGEYRLRRNGSDVVEPAFRGDLTADTVVVGFALTEQQVRGDDGDPGYFFVLEEQPRDSRFGLDEPQREQNSADEPQGKRDSSGWSDITWADVTPASHGGPEPWDGPIDLNAPTVASLPTNPPWNRSAAEMALILFQQPYRIALHARLLLPPDTQP